MAERRLTFGSSTGRRVRAFWPNVMTPMKYVASNTRDSSDWQPNVFLSGDIAEKVREIQQQDGPDIQIMGSADLLQTLFKNDLVDEMELMIMPITLGEGKRLFQDGNIPASFKVTTASSRQTATSASPTYATVTLKQGHRE